jgi:tetratricopeptide (TPR) repeat protein
LEAAATEARAARTDDVLAHAYYLLDWALTDLGRPEAAARYRELALPMYERLGDLSGQANVLNNLGIDAYYEGRWEEAIELYERSRQARERSGDVVQLGLAANNIGEILSDQGKIEEAAALFREALRVWRGSNFRIGDGVATSNLGRAAARSGRYDEARDRYEEAAAIFESIGATSFRADVDAREAERCLFAGDAVRALSVADAVCVRVERDRTATPAVISMAHRIAGCALAVIGAPSDALARIDRATAIAEEASAEFELALAHDARARVLASVGDDSAEAYSIAAAALLDQLGVASTFSSYLDAALTAQPR